MIKLPVCQLPQVFLSLNNSTRSHTLKECNIYAHGHSALVLKTNDDAVNFLQGDSEPLSVLSNSQFACNSYKSFV